MRSLWISFAVALFVLKPGFGQEAPLNVLVIGAHPDDCDSCAGGTAIQWAALGHRVKFLSLTNGDAGHQSEGGGALAKRRRAEAQEAGRRLGISEYEVLDNHDGELEPTLAVRGQVIRAIRRWKADVVILPRPNDYHPDHRNTGLVVQDAAYMVIVPNVAPDTAPLSQNPVFLYCRDSFQRPNPFRPDVAVDITAVYERKIEALDAHVSQFYEWLPWTEGSLADVPRGTDERKRWLAETRARPIAPEVEAALERGYGLEAARRAVHAESFEICEYGRKPGEKEMRRLFPMVSGARR